MKLNILFFWSLLQCFFYLPERLEIRSSSVMHSPNNMQLSNPCFYFYDSHKTDSGAITPIFDAPSVIIFDKSKQISFCNDDYIIGSDDSAKPSYKTHRFSFGEFFLEREDGNILEISSCYGLRIFYKKFVCQKISKKNELLLNKILNNFKITKRTPHFLIAEYLSTSYFCFVKNEIAYILDTNYALRYSYPIPSMTSHGVSSKMNTRLEIPISEQNVLIPVLKYDVY